MPSDGGEIESESMIKSEYSPSTNEKNNVAPRTSEEKPRIDEENLQLLSSKNASRVKYPPACPVWYNLEFSSTPSKRLTAGHGVVKAVYIDFETSGLYYKVIDEVVENGKLSAEQFFRQDQLAFGTNCPVRVKGMVENDPTKEMKGRVLCPTPGKTESELSYSVRFIEGNNVRVELEVGSDKITYRKMEKRAGMEEEQPSSIKKETQNVGGKNNASAQHNLKEPSKRGELNNGHNNDTTAAKSSTQPGCSSTEQPSVISVCKVETTNSPHLSPLPKVSLSEKFEQINNDSSTTAFHRPSTTAVAKANIYQLDSMMPSSTAVTKKPDAYDDPLCPARFGIRKKPSTGKKPNRNKVCPAEPTGNNIQVPSAAEEQPGIIHAAKGGKHSPVVGDTRASPGGPPPASHDARSDCSSYYWIA